MSTLTNQQIIQGNYCLIEWLRKPEFRFFMVGGTDTSRNQTPEGIFFRLLLLKKRRIFYLSAFESYHTKNEQRACWLRSLRCACRT